MKKTIFLTSIIFITLFLSIDNIYANMNVSHVKAVTKVDLELDAEAVR
jgi:hypothetical protein